MLILQSRAVFMAKSLVVIPSVRNPAVVSDYIKNAAGRGFDTGKLHLLVITEDSVEKRLYESEAKDFGASIDVYNQADRERFFKDFNISKYSMLIPKKSHAETSFGLLYLWVHKEFEYAFLIDDDTEPHPKFNFFGEHISNLNYSGEVTEVSSDKRWVNVLHDNYANRGLYPRGYPYSKMGETNTKLRKRVKTGDVWISQGLWTNVPDLDAIRILMDGDLNGQAKTRLSADDFKENFVVARDNFLTVCSMNLALRREIVPFFYQFPMDDNRWRIGRFDDIWSGIIAKKALDILGKDIITGFPLCIHNKAMRSTFKDVNAEAPGYESNEHFSETVSAYSHATGDVFELARGLARKVSDDGVTEFTRYCGDYFGKWVEMIAGLA